MKSLIKKPSAWIPIVLSLAMLVFIVSIISVKGIPEPDPNADEGTAAHLFQLWLVVEALMIGFFGAKWLPKVPPPALIILAIQILAVVAACFPVFYFQF